MAGPNVSDKVRASGGARLADMKKTQQQESELYGVGSGLSVDELAMLRSGGESQANINLLNELRKSQQIQNARERLFNPTLGQMVRDIGTPAGALGAANGLTFGLPAAAYNAMQSPEGKQAFKEWQFQNPGFGYGTSAGDLATWAIPGGAMLKGAGRVAGAVGAGETAANLANAGRYLQGPMSLGTMVGQAAEQGVPRLAASAINGELDGGAAAGASLAALPYLGRGGVVVSGRVFPMAEKLYNEALNNPNLANKILSSSPKKLGGEAALFNPTAVAQGQQFRLSGQGPIVNMPMTNTPVVDLSRYLGHKVIPISFDRTMAGQTSYDLGGIPFSRPLVSLGGIRFHEQPFSITQGDASASGFEASQGAQNKYLEASAQGYEPLVMSMAMKAPGSNFATHTTQSLLNAIPAIDSITPEAIASLNADIRKPITRKVNGKLVTTAFPDFPGVEHPDSQFAILAPNAGPLRLRIADTMDTQGYQYAGFPTTSMAHEALNDPSIPYELGAMGGMMFKPDLNVRKIASLGYSNHPAYPARIPKAQGEPVTQLEYQPHWTQLFKSAVDANPNKRLDQIYRSLYLGGMREHYPVVNDELVNRMGEFNDMMRANGGVYPSK